MTLLLAWPRAWEWSRSSSENSIPWRPPHCKQLMCFLVSAAWQPSSLISSSFVLKVNLFSTICPPLVCINIRYCFGHVQQLTIKRVNMSHHSTAQKKFQLCVDDHLTDNSFLIQAAGRGYQMATIFMFCFHFISFYGLLNVGAWWIRTPCVFNCLFFPSFSS